jgi:hypothetical protein
MKIIKKYNYYLYKVIMSIATLGKYPSDSSANVVVNTDTLSPLSSATIAGLTGLTGMMVFNSTVGAVQYYNGSVWESLANGGTGVAPFYDRRTIQSTITGIWTVAPGVQVDAQRSGDVCVLTVTAATGFNNVSPPLINGGTAEGGTNTGSISIASLPATIYAPQNGNAIPSLVETVSGGIVVAQPGISYTNTGGTSINVIWSADATGEAEVYFFPLIYMGVPNPH